MASSTEEETKKEKETTMKEIFSSKEQSMTRQEFEGLAFGLYVLSTVGVIVWFGSTVLFGF